MISIDPEAAWTAFLARDRAADGRFVASVATTGIYCRPSCPARRPRREHVAFYSSLADAEAAGFRACLRCRPDHASRDTVAVVAARALLDAAKGAVSLEAVAAHVGYAPHHFHRLFRRETGATPAAYARQLRADRAAAALGEALTITDAIYDAGYAAPSRFYAEVTPRLGMTPGAWRRGGAGVTIRWTVATTSLGPLLVAATDKGLARVAFDEDEAALRERFPRATLLSGDAALAGPVVEAIEHPDRAHALPLDARGTAFQHAIWRALAAIPPSETRSYAELATAAGHPAAVRAAGSACAANPLAVLVPCHRARRGDGGAGGYAWGLDRKQALLDRETRADEHG